TSLSRSLVLLLKAQGGEEGLPASHGLETVDWGSVMSGDTSNGIKQLCDLRIRTTAGLFSEFVKYTENRLSIHIRSGSVDWHINYAIPPQGDELTLGDLLERIPDLHQDYANVADSSKYASIIELTFNNTDGFAAKIKEPEFSKIKDTYE